MNTENAPPDRVSWTYALIWTAVHGVIWAGFLLAATLFLPKVEATLMDFGVAPPAPLRWIFVATRLVVINAGWARLALLVFLGLDAYIMTELGSPSEPGGSARRWAVIMLVIPLLLLVLTAAVIAVPMIGLSSRLAG